MSFKKSIISLAVVATLAPAFVFAAPTTSQPKEATTYTIQKNDQLKQYLNFDNKSDFEDASRGFIAKWPEKTIKDAQGNVVWDFSKFDFINQDKDTQTINH